MPRAGDRDHAKEQQWRQVFTDWEASGLGVAEYCRKHGITVSQFYAWRKRLTRRDGEKVPTHRERMAVRAQAIAKKLAREKRRIVEFAEVQVIERQPRSVNQPTEEHHVGLEVVFASGTKVRLTPGCPLDLFATVVHLLENR